jgi:hypothetical protein
MAKQKVSSAAPILAALAIVAALLAVYVAGYLWLGSVGHATFARGGVMPRRNQPPDLVYRTYRQNWQAMVFKPAAAAERLIRGGAYVRLGTEDPTIEEMSVIRDRFLQKSP